MNNSFKFVFIIINDKHVSQLQERAKQHNEQIIKEIEFKFRDKILKLIGQVNSKYLPYDIFINLFINSKQTAFEEVSPCLVLHMEKDPWIRIIIVFFS